MERRYLVAALAIIATFAVFSRGFHALQRMSVEHSDNYRTMATARCWASSAAQTVAKVRSHFRHGYPPEQAQLVAEMNMPGMESTIAEQMARQDTAIARCARERAMREADRARRDAVRIQKDYMRAYAHPTPAALAMAFPADLSQQIQAQIAERQVQLQAAQQKLEAIEIPAIDVDTEVTPPVAPTVKCKVKISKQAMRDAMRGLQYQYQYGFTSR
ncbi:MAG TPA: hypothetical protein VGG15_06350 [Terriglobales bacterium]|jgi:hypothetical protein